ncbi:MAG: UdgX family uracil-DNA binding protein [Pseudomonadota bacterium]
MHTIRLSHQADFKAWRSGARTALEAGLAVRNVRFVVGDEPGDLFAGRERKHKKQRDIRVPKDFMALAERALCHSDAGRFTLLYDLADRLQHKPLLLKDRADAQVHRMNVLAKEVARDKHKMTAFVRFRKVETEDADLERYIAWFEPTHHSLEYSAPFFVRRFTGMQWSIVTPERSAHWDGKQLRFGKGAAKSDVPQEDALEDYWRTYYAHIFNPARVKLKAMQAEMPKKYWKNLPEAELIESLTRSSGARVKDMIQHAPHFAPPAAPAPVVQPLKPAADLAEVKAQLAKCSQCQLCQGATQAVAGVGPSRAKIMLVGEQPGDQEDLAGLPFVGPAGQVLGDALAEAGIDRQGIYLTNAVKHFKYEMRGKRRLHKRPNRYEVDACRWWLGQELKLVKPDVILALGATAQYALLRRNTPISKARLETTRLKMGPEVSISYHPSAILRARSAQEKAQLFDLLVGDLVAVHAKASLLETA